MSYEQFLEEPRHVIKYDLAFEKMENDMERKAIEKSNSK